MLKFVSLLCLLLGVASLDSNEVSKSKEELAKCDQSTEQNIRLSANEHAYINCQKPRAGSLNVLIDAPNSTDGLSLEINSLVNFKNPEDFKVFAVTNDTDRSIFQGIPNTKVWLPTGQKKIRVKADNIAEGSISVKVVQSCGVTFDVETFLSPILPNQPLPGPVTATCTFKLTSAARIEFTGFQLAKGSEASFNGSDTNELAGPFSDKGPDHIIIVRENWNFILKLNLSEPHQNVTFNRFPLSGAKVCGSQSMALASKKLSIEVPSSPSTASVSCMWLIAAPENQKLSLTVTNVNLKHAVDLISVVDAGNSTGAPLVQLTALSMKTDPMISSQRYLLVSLEWDNADSVDKFSFDVAPISNGGHLFRNGTMKIQGDSEYLLSTSDAENLVVSFSSVVKLNGSQKIEVIADSQSLIVFDANQKLFDLSSPGSMLQIKAPGFTEAVNIEFTSKPRGSGCSRTFTAPLENNLRLIGSCTGQCTWIVKPKVSSETTELFMRFLPNNVPSGTITHFKDTGGKVSIANSADPFIISYQVAYGAWIEFDCSNAKDFEMSYVTKLANQDLSVSAAPGANFTLTSPFFPGIYPEGGQFVYNVSVANKATNYFASVHTMDLLPQHTLTIGSKSSVFHFTGTDLPGDALIPASSLADTIFNTTAISADSNRKGAFGFYISLSPASNSQKMSDASKSFSTGEKCDSLRCVFIVEVARPANINESVSLNLTVALPKNATLKDSDLLVWDGESVLRSPLIAPIANLTKGGLFASRSNKIIIVYTGSLNLALSYVSSPCSYGSNTMCLMERLCMPSWWRCDEKLHCKDGSDELACSGGKPPNPTPDPTPTSSSGWKVAFWLFMPLFILLGFALDRGVPIIIQKLRDSRYHQFHDLGDH